VRYRERAKELDVDDDEVKAWQAAAEAMVVPFDAELGITAQSEGFTRYRRWDFAATLREAYPLLMSCPYYLLYSSQVVKQADLVLAVYTCGDYFDPEQKRRDFAYYEPITVRDSTLSASIQAIVAAEVGHLELAYEYLRETALVDLRDLAGNTADGVHLASLAGAWLVAVAGFGGMRDHGEILTFAPTLPPRLRRLCFRLLYRRRCIKVEIVPGEARYELAEGDPIEVVHHGQRVRLAAGSLRVLPWEPPPPGPPAAPPPGREPSASGVGAD
jgi:alpha,alpha-trehalose phosphorylase